MKKLMILLAVLLTANVMMAQKKDKTDAYMYNKNGQYEKAMISVEKCVNHAQFAGMKPYDQATVWHYRAQIYQNILNSGDPDLIAKAPNALEIIYESLMQCMANQDYLNDNKQDIYQRVAIVMGSYCEQGYALTDAKQFAEASPYFKKAYDIAKSLGTPDANDWLNNAAQSSLLAKDYNTALAYYNELKDNGVETGDLYHHLVICYNGLGNTEMAKQMITAGLEKNPSDAQLLLEKVNVYLQEDRGEEVADELNRLKEMDPNNAPLLFALGTIYGNREKESIYNPEKAAEFYKDAIRVNPEYYDAIYNLGVLYLWMAEPYIKEANEITGISDAELKRYNELMDQANELLTTGLPYVKQVYEAQPNDDVKNILKSMYVQLKMYDEVKALNEK